MSLNGRDPELARAIMANGVAVQYHKIAPVWAFTLSETLDIDTPEGTMHADIGDYLVSDDPPTHLWPVKREVFERTYESQAEWSAFVLRDDPSEQP